MSRSFESLRIPIEETNSVYKNEIASRQGSINRCDSLIATDNKAIREYFDHIFNGDLFITEQYQKNIYDRIDRIAPYEEQIDILSGQIRKIEENINCKESLICGAKKLEEIGVVDLFERIIDSGILRNKGSQLEKICWGDKGNCVSIVFDIHNTDWECACRGGKGRGLDNLMGEFGEPYYFYCTFGINEEGDLIFDERGDNYYHSSFDLESEEESWFFSFNRYSNPVKIKTNDIPKCIEKVVLEYARFEDYSSNRLTKGLNKIFTGNNH